MKSENYDGDVDSDMVAQGSHVYEVRMKPGLSGFTYIRRA